MEQTITDVAQIGDLEGNTIVGVPELDNSKIVFVGTGNVLYCENGVRLRDSTITFNGSGGLVVLGASKHVYYLAITVNNNCSFVVGRDVYFNGQLGAVVSEERTIAIGDGCLLSFGIFIRTADPHLIFDVKTHRRINPSKDVVVGDHVWIGQDALLLKGATIGSGSIVGARSVVAGKRIPSNASWAGNPVRRVRDDVFWEGSCVHTWTGERTQKSERYRSGRFIYKVGRHTLDGCFVAPAAKSPEERLEHYLSVGYGKGHRNRLAIGAAAEAPGTVPASARVERPEKRGGLGLLRRLFGR